MTICTSFEKLFAGKDYVVLQSDPARKVFEPKIEHLNFIQQFFRWLLGCYAETHLTTLNKHVDFLTTFSSQDETLNTLVQKVCTKILTSPSISGSEASVGSITYPGTTPHSVRLRWNQERRDGKESTEVSVGVPAPSYPDHLCWIPLCKDSTGAVHMRMGPAMDLAVATANILKQVGYPPFWTLRWESGFSQKDWTLHGWEHVRTQTYAGAEYVTFRFTENEILDSIRIVSKPFGFYVGKAPTTPPWNVKPY